MFKFLKICNIIGAVIGFLLFLYLLRFVTDCTNEQNNKSILELLFMIGMCITNAIIFDKLKNMEKDILSLQAARSREYSTKLNTPLNENQQSEQKTPKEFKSKL